MKKEAQVVEKLPIFNRFDHSGRFTVETLFGFFEPQVGLQPWGVKYPLKILIYRTVDEMGALLKMHF